MAWTTLVTVAELAPALDGRQAVVDCRASLADPAKGRSDWLAAHLPGAVHADLEQDLSGPHAPGAGRHPMPSAEALCRSLSRLGIEPGQQVVAYDAGDGAMAAARLWWLLRELGHRDVAVLDGGFTAWCEAGLTLQEGETRPDPALYPVRAFASGGQIQAEALRGELETGSVCLVDARAGQRFRGEVEPIDRVAGHVPGARNRPYTDNLVDGLRFKDGERLRSEWTALLDGRPPRRTVLMCGSGVTACHHALALEHAGLAGYRLYAPSWSGWIEDPARPIATGA